MAKRYAVVVGAVLTLIGILGFVRAEMFGLHFNTIHNVIHLLSGVIGLWAGLGGGAKGAKMFAQVFGVVYTLVALVGFAGVPAFLTTMLDLNTLYNVIHLAVGLLGLLAGFTAAKTGAA